MCPTYEYHCGVCGEHREAFHPVNRRNEEICCGHEMQRLISSTGRPVVYEYFSENLNAQITGPAQRKQVMKERGVEEVG